MPSPKGPGQCLEEGLSCQYCPPGCCLLEDEGSKLLGSVMAKASGYHLPLQHPWDIGAC